MQNLKNIEIKQSVREAYAEVAKSDGAGCGCACGCGSAETVNGYSQNDLQSIPDGAHMSLGSGTPLSTAALQEGESVLDLGSGGGVDCFLAAKQVGTSGRVIGVDMTPEMVAKARKNALNGNYKNVDFRLGEIEHLPVVDCSVDVIVSNCVLNLSTDKAVAYAEAFRVLKPGGRVSISDVVMMADIPQAEREDLTLHASCIAGAAFIDHLERFIADAGFTQIRIELKTDQHNISRQWVPGSDIAEYAVSASIQAIKPDSPELKTG